MKKKIFALLNLFFCVNSSMAQRVEFIHATDSARKYIAENHLRNQHNSFVDKDNVIHIFMFEDGNLLIKGYPTMATEKNKFQLHLFVTSSNTDAFILEYDGNYLPEYTGFASRGGPPTIERIDFAILGPFTSKLTLSIKHKPEGTKEYVPFTTTSDIQISKTIYASIGSGLIYTSLKNPKPHPVTLPGGDTTLVADDFNGRGMITVMATFYPWGRNNLLVPDWSFRDRFGILVGTAIASSPNNFDNFFLGGQFDFSIGGSVVTGLHYGRRQKIRGVNYRNFNFGESKFTGDLEQNKYMGWDFGFFIGVQVDSRIFSKLFPNAGL